ncbi:MAG: hypothetical protein KGH59_00320 [Candidatus Micrarchaeota archaeon]|nr:hypothetical protein [Candidatus Micrarchaeota archaeon]MDE1804218.1 hypothetical protein [Candidatus Micrarchaeota archaeon]MDE1846674.1 hypothetical protein [Candidatus Micrarchaeota archaeon]
MTKLYAAAIIMLLVLPQLAIAYNASLLLPNATASGGFYDSNNVAFIYNRPYFCTPPSNTLFPKSSDAQAAMSVNGCELGVSGNNLAADPQWIVVPAYAGLTVFGIKSSPQGFPIYQNATVITQCGVGDMISKCPDHPSYLYSPIFTEVEKYLNITSGVVGLPEGVLPTPAHDHVISDDELGADTNWYNIGVFVFDPNIMPNATDGKCHQVVPSNLSDPTANCLTSLSALAAAMQTQSSSVGAANANNPIWNAIGRPRMQIFVPNDSLVSQINNSNSNFKIPFSVASFNYYRGIFAQSSQQVYTQLEIGAAVIVLAAIVVAIVLLRMRRKGGSSTTAASQAP